MSIKEFVKRHQGMRDERIVAETNKIYKKGFLALAFGLLVFFTYDTMRSQVAFVNGLSDTVEVSLSLMILYAWLFVVVLACALASTLKGFVDDGRFAETDYFPAGYFALWSFCAALGSGFAVALLRALAEFELVGASGIMWAADAVLGFSFSILIFLACYANFYLAFRAAKRRRETLALRFED